MRPTGIVTDQSYAVTLDSRKRVVVPDWEFSMEHQVNCNRFLFRLSRMITYNVEDLEEISTTEETNKCDVAERG